MHKKLKYLLLLIPVFAAACGYNSTARYNLPLPVVSTTQCACTDTVQSKPSTTPASVNTIKATPSPKPSAASLSQDEKARLIYDKMVEKIKNIDSFKMSVHHYVKGNLKNLKPVDKPVYGIATNYIVFKRPRKMFIKITDSKDDPSLNDTRLLYDGGDSLKIKVPGILGLFTFTFPLSKPELSNYRGYTVADIDIVSLEKQLDTKEARVKLIGTSEVFGVPVYILEITGIKTIDKDVTKVVMGVSKKDFVPVLHEMYVGEDLVYQEKFQDFSVNIPVTDEDFKL